jgi:hypothetical protein
VKPPPDRCQEARPKPYAARLNASSIRSFKL